MRVAAHNGATIWGGAERATAMLLRGLMERGHDVILFCNNEEVARRAAEEEVPTRICVIAGDVALLHAFRLASELRSFHADVFIVGTFKKLFLATLGARLAKVPRVVARVGLESDTPRSVKYRIALRRWTDGVVVNARRMITPFASLDGFGPEKVTLIHNGVRLPTTQEHGHSLRAELGIESGCVVIGTVARLAKQKRIDRLLEVAERLSANVHVVIAGDGTRRTELESQSVARGLATRVHFLGHRDDRDAVFEALDIFVVASDREGLSNAMLEAMARGIPIVSTPVSGAEEALLADASGPAAGIITGFDASSMARAIQDLIDSPDQAAAMGDAARDRATRVFSLDAMLDQWETLLFASASRAS